MRRGTTLIETLVLVPILLAVMVVFSGVFYASLHDVPQLQKVAHTNGVLSHMLVQLQQDIDAAESLPDSTLGETASDTVLLLRMGDGAVVYRIQDDEIVREELASGGNGMYRKPYRWPVPGAKVSFHGWARSGLVYAVEVRRAVEYEKPEYTEEKLVNRHVLYPASMPGVREAQ